MGEKGVDERAVQFGKDFMLCAGILRETGKSACLIFIICDKWLIVLSLPGGSATNELLVVQVVQNSAQIFVILICLMKGENVDHTGYS